MKTIVSLLSYSFLIALAVLFSYSNAFTCTTGKFLSKTTSLHAQQQGNEVDRSSFIRKSLQSTMPFALLLLNQNQSAALAKDVDPGVKGTKADPKFQACLSQCIYECTKPKGDEQKSRAECLPECKAKCAETKEQMIKGTPKS